MSSAAVADSVTSHADNGAGILVGDDSGVRGRDDTGGAHGVASSNRVGDAFIGVETASTASAETPLCS